ncbi:hypothetical protein NLY09_09415 (plasmid) [Burkholderia vietnamiensis]
MSERPSANNPVLLTIKPADGKGRAFAYNQGRVFEPANGLIKAPWLPTQFPRGLLDNAQSKETLSAFFTEEGRVYFSTEQGLAELEAIVKVSQEAKTKLNQG